MDASSLRSRHSRLGGVFFFAFALGIPLFAREIAPAEAGLAAFNWLRRNPAPLGASLVPTAGAVEVRTETDGAGLPLFHLVRVGGGVVVTSADDGIVPVVAFSDAGGIPEDDGNPFWTILRSAMTSRRTALADRTAASIRPAPQGAVRAAAEGAASPEALWSRLLSGRPSATGRIATLGNGLETISDLRVPPLVRSKWGQSRNIYNHLTPSNYVCGCVATAMAQVMRYHRYPVQAVPPKKRLCRINGQIVEMTTEGGLYDWEAMDLVPDRHGISETSRDAIAKICRDTGVSVYMNWMTNGAAAAPYAPALALKDFFGYANAVGYSITPSLYGNIPDADAARVLRSNFDARLPVILGITNHAVVGDGYGYEGSRLYVHLNMGWEGQGDFWYNLPHVHYQVPGFEYESKTFSSVVYNISPTNRGVLLTGRVTDHANRPLPGARVEARFSAGTISTTAGDGGIYALWVQPGTYATEASTWRKRGSAPAAMVRAAESTVYAEFASHAGLGFYNNTGTIGNLAGNDIVLYATAAEPLPVVIGGDGAHPLLPGDGPGAFPGPDGFVVRFRAPEGSALYTLQATDDLSKPFRNVGTTRASHSENDLIELLDPSPRSPARFYRVLVE